MQLFNINPNTFQRTLTGEYSEYEVELAKNGNTREDTVSYLNGNILFSINQNSKALKELLKTHWSVAREDDERANRRNTESEMYLNDVTTTIIKSQEKFTLRNALVQIDEIAEALGDKLAGCLLVSGKTIINPLHPITALVLMDEERNLYGDEFKIVTYLYNNKSQMHYTYHSNKADVSKIRRNIMSLISLYSNKQGINRTVEVNRVTREDKDIPLSNLNRFYRESVSADNEYEGDFVIIPHQLLTKGIVAPFYGTSVIIREDSTSRGALLCPMHSANVSSTYHRNGTEPKFDGICTGNTPKTSMDGLRTLNHANLSSPLHSANMEAGSILYADECIRQSINLYRLGGFLTKQEPDKPTVSAFDDLEAELEEQNHKWEAEDAEHERISSHNDVVDALRYATATTQAFGDGTALRGEFATVPTGTFYNMNDLYRTGTAYTHTVNGEFRPLAADNIHVRPEDTAEIGNIHGVRIIGVDMADEALQEAHEEFRNELGERLAQRADEMIRETIQGEPHEQETTERESEEDFGIEDL